MTRIVHLSDLHFGAVTPGLVEPLLAQIHALKPDLTVISGDLTQSARTVEFQAAGAFIARLPRPHLVVPGNHDLANWRLPERLFFPWHKWLKYIGRELDPVVQGKDFLAIGLNTARQLSRTLDWSRGRINARQLALIEAQAAASPVEQLRVLVTHHPFSLIEDARHRGLIGRLKMAWPRLQAVGIDLVLSGHLHLAYAIVRDGTIIAHAGSGISHRLRGETNSFNLIEASKQRIEITQMAWQQDRFIQGLQQHFERGNAGFAQTQLIENPSHEDL